jgi:ABC-type bacteriocin/lantibiotic exporter with double-glycine peptidase domain
MKVKTFFDFFEQIVSMAYPILAAGGIQWFMNSFAQDKTASVTLLMSIAVGFVLVNTGMRFISSYLEDMADVFREAVGYALEENRAAKLSRIRFPLFMDPASVNIIENSKIDVFDLRDLAFLKLGLVNLLISVVFGIVLSITLNPLIFFACFILAITGDRIKSFFWKKTEEKRDELAEKEREGDSYRIHGENLANFMQFSAWGHIGYMIRRAVEINRGIIATYREINRSERRAQLIWTPIVLITIVSIGLWMVHDSFKRPQGFLYLGVWYAAFKSMTGSLNGLFSFWRHARKDARKFERYDAFLKLGERPVDAAKLPEARSYRITLDQVVFRYPSRNEAAVDGLSLTIEQGERVALVGNNGSGKTTTLHLLSGFLDPLAGSVCVNGHNLQGIDITSWFQVMGFVSQNSDIGMTVGELVYGSVPPSEAEALIWQALESVGLAEVIHSLEHGIRSRIGEAWSDGTNFSTGQSQKLRLAVVMFKVLCGKVKVVMLDEPTANLDVDSKTSLISSLAKYGVTLIVAVHDQSLLPQFTRIVELSDGRLVSDRTV